MVSLPRSKRGRKGGVSFLRALGTIPMGKADALGFEDASVLILGDQKDLDVFVALPHGNGDFHLIPPILPISADTGKRREIRDYRI
jgi:hypothetical protein